MERPLISIIMPVYGVENYVGRAIESIQAQTYDNWELLCVDDGTKDRSGTICEEYAFSDERITVFHKENGGAPSARNFAMDKASGDYFYFMDSDDWAEPDMLEDMVTLAEEQQAQLVVSGFYIDTYYNEDQCFTQVQTCPSAVYKSQKEFRQNAMELFDQNLLYSPWNKLTRADYLMENQIYFPQTFWDDFPFVLMVIRDVERVAVIGKAYYHFIRQRQESETARYRDGMFEKRLEEDRWMMELYQHWGFMNPTIQEFLDRRHVERLFGCLENFMNQDCPLSVAQKMKEIHLILKNQRTREAAFGAVPRSAYMRVMLIPIKWGLVLPVYVESKVISAVKHKNVRLFAKLKAYR